MRLKFQLKGDTFLAPKEVNDKLILALGKREYEIVDFSEEIILFKFSRVAISMQSKLKRIKKGRLEISILNDKTIVKFTYYIYLWAEILFSTFFGIVGIVNRDYNLFYAVLLMSVFVFLKIFFQNEEANDIFEEL